MMYVKTAQICIQTVLKTRPFNLRLVDPAVVFITQVTLKIPD